MSDKQAVDELSLFLGYEGGFDGADEESVAANDADEVDEDDLFGRVVTSQGGERLSTPHWNA